MGTTLTVLPEGVNPAYVYVPQGFKGEPQTIGEVLQRTKAALQEEDRWLQNRSAANIGLAEDGQFNPEDPFCGSWKACLTGMVNIVTVGYSLAETENAHYLAYGNGNRERACKLASRTLSLLDAVAASTDGGGSAINVNDGKGRTAVMWLLTAAQKAYGIIEAAHHELDAKS